MYKSDPMKRLPVEIMARGGNCLFQRFCPLTAIEIIQNNMQLQILVVYLTTLSDEDYRVSHCRSAELERLWKEAIMAYTGIILAFTWRD